MALLAIPFGLAIGLSLGMFGGGGSVLAVPVLVYVLGQDVSSATTASLVVATSGALAGGLSHHRAGQVCWRHAAVFAAAALPGTVAGTTAGDHAGGGAVLAAFAVLMLLGALATWRRAGRHDAQDDRDGATPCPPLRLAREGAAGVVVGFLTGFFGVGGGFLIVPTLAVALAFTMRAAVGTSLAIMIATSLLALVAHLAAGRTLDVTVTAALAGACVVGALAGGRLAGRVPQRALGRGFAALLAAVAGYLIVATAFLGGPPGG